MSRKTLWIAVSVLLALGCAAAQAQSPAGTAFTYQGQLKLNNVPVNNPADFIFKLFDAATGGTQVGADVPVANLAVSQGLFTARLDFGGSAFGGEARWLEVWVRSPAGGGSYTQLSPRQELTATPYALFSGAPWTTGSGGVSYSGGSVGIGTSNPGAQLHVGLPGGGGNAVARVGGSQPGGGGADGDFLQLESGDTSGSVVRFDGAELFFWNPNWGTIMSLTRDGNVGIGTTFPAAPFTVDGYRNGIAGWGRTLQLEAYAPNVLFHETQTNNFFRIGLWNGSKDLYLQSFDNDGANVDTHMAIVNGNVGIGTSAPGSRLTVAGNEISLYAGTLNGDSYQQGSIRADNVNGFLFSAPVVNGVRYDTGFTHRGDAKPSVVFKGDGNVGIGTTTPQFTLDVAGRGHFRDASDVPLVLGGIQTGGGGADGDVMFFETHGTSGCTQRFDQALLSFYNPNAGFIMTMTRDGNVGIGTTTPTSPLTVEGIVQSTYGGFKFPDGTVQTTAAAGGVGGGGTVNYVPKFTAPTTLGNSAIVDVDGKVCINTDQPQARLTAFGSLNPDVFLDGVHGYTRNGNGVSGYSQFMSGVYGEGATGVYGKSTSGEAGHFEGPVTVAGKVGIGTTSGGRPLEIRAQTGTNEWLGLRTQSDGVGWHINNINGGFNLAETYVADGRIFAKPGGNVGINTLNPQSTLDVAGTTRTHVLEITGGADLAEPFVVNSRQPSAIGSQPEDGAPDSELVTRNSELAILPGMVVVIDPDRPGQLTLAMTAYDRKVAGVISGANGVQPGMVMSGLKNAATQAEPGAQATGPDPALALGAPTDQHPVALTGRVWCWCDATHGAIEPGDRLTTSDTPGHAMKVSDDSRAGGAVLGKAMTQLEDGKGLVLVLVQPQ